MNIREMGRRELAADWTANLPADLPTELAADVAADLPSRFATLLRLLVEIIDSPTARSRERLRAARTLKTCLGSLQCVLESGQTSSQLRRDIVEVLRAYRRS
jgi:hypothetical protein